MILTGIRVDFVTCAEIWSGLSEQSFVKGFYADRGLPVMKDARYM